MWILPATLGQSPTPVPAEAGWLKVDKPFALLVMLDDYEGVLAATMPEGWVSLLPRHGRNS
jgi:hypothetical protein